jgi:hypothetical protein
MTTHTHPAGSEPYAALGAADIERAASTLDPIGEENDRVTVIVNDQAYDPIELLARAASIEPDQVRLATALVALARLEFVPAGTSGGTTPDAPPLPTTRGEQPLRGDDAGLDTTAIDDDTAKAGTGVVDAAEDDLTHSDLTPALAQHLQRFRGQWVAVKRGDLLAHASTLRDLLAEAGDHGASVLFVPLKDEHSDA